MEGGKIEILGTDRKDKKRLLSGREEEEGGMTLDCEEGIKIVSLSCALGKMDI